MDIKSRLGWRPDVPDNRDGIYKAPRGVAAALPPSVDLAPTQPPIWDQGSLGSCTANSTGAQCWFLDTTDPYEPSRLFIYYNTRMLEGTVRYDAGASIRNSIKSVVQRGFCQELDWPYEIRKFTTRPSQRAYANGKFERISQYVRVLQQEKSLKSALAEGKPVNFGFSVYSSLDSDITLKTGYVKLPAGRTDRLLGGHAVLLIGYDDETQHYKFRNSWGTGWGSQGYGFLPYAYVHNPSLAADFWVIHAVP